MDNPKCCKDMIYAFKYESIFRSDDKEGYYFAITDYHNGERYHILYCPFCGWFLNHEN